MSVRFWSNVKITTAALPKLQVSNSFVKKRLDMDFFQLYLGITKAGFGCLSTKDDFQKLMLDTLLQLTP